MPFYIASCVHVSDNTNPGEVRQCIFTREEAAMAFVEHRLDIDGYADLGWKELPSGLVYQSDTARGEGQYNYGQVNIFDTDSITNPVIVLEGI